MSTAGIVYGRSLVQGTARGEVALLSTPLSLWGGFDLETGRISDVHHLQTGLQIAGKILAMPGGRGSSSSSSILLESARLSVNPGAIILTEKDPIIVMGALVAADLYEVHIPVILIDAAGMDQLSSESNVDVDVVARADKASIALHKY